MWLGLRRHLEVSEAIFVLQVLVEHSGWREIKRTDNEKTERPITSCVMSAGISVQGGNILK
jgi:hypothetical protein